MLGCPNSLMRHKISRFSQVECTFSNIPTCVHLPVGGTLPSAFGVTCIRFVLQGHRLIVAHFNELTTLFFPKCTPLRFLLRTLSAD